MTNFDRDVSAVASKAAVVLHSPEGNFSVPGSSASLVVCKCGEHLYGDVRTAFQSHFDRMAARIVGEMAPIRVLHPPEEYR